MATVASLDTGEISAFSGKNSYDSFQGAPKWTNQVTLRSLEMFLEHDALSYADKIGPVPLLMIVEDEDTLAAVDLSLDAYKIEGSLTRLIAFGSLSVRDMTVDLA